MARRGRPFKPEARRATAVVRLEERHIGRLDHIIRDRSWVRAPIVGQVADREMRDAGGAGDPPDQTISYAVERRRLLGDLIDHSLSDAVLFPTEVRLLLPDVGNRFDALSEVVAWEKAESERLTKTAPVAVRAALKANELRGLQRTSPAEYLVLLTSALAQRKGDEDP